MKNDDEMPKGWETGTIHLDPVPGYWKPVKFIVKGWYINHHREPNIHRLIKNGNALAIKFFDKEEAYKPVGADLKRQSREEHQRAKTARRRIERGGPYAYQQLVSEVHAW